MASPRIKAKTMKEFLEELEKKKAQDTSQDEELVSLIRKYGVVDGALMWMARHPEEAKQIIEKGLKEVLGKEG